MSGAVPSLRFLVNARDAGTSAVAFERYTVFRVDMIEVILPGGDLDSVQFSKLGGVIGVKSRLHSRPSPLGVLSEIA